LVQDAISAAWSRTPRPLTNARFTIQLVTAGLPSAARGALAAAVDTALAAIPERVVTAWFRTDTTDANARGAICRLKASETTFTTTAECAAAVGRGLLAVRDAIDTRLGDTDASVANLGAAIRSLLAKESCTTRAAAPATVDVRLCTILGIVVARRRCADIPTAVAGLAVCIVYACLIVRAACTGSATAIRAGLIAVQDSIFAGGLQAEAAVADPASAVRTNGARLTRLALRARVAATIDVRLGPIGFTVVAGFLDAQATSADSARTVVVRLAV
jgi:hypothetical protein